MITHLRQPCDSHSAKVTLTCARACHPTLSQALGTWFTWCSQYTEESAESDVETWDELGLPLDVWGLDMNWRNTSSN